MNQSIQEKFLGQKNRILDETDKFLEKYNLLNCPTCTQNDL